MSESLHLTRNGSILEITLIVQKRMLLMQKPALKWAKYF
ncbi:Uncharacterised protein [Escherichia coli]|uniref:Uncharacterized protein n=1 Tax=Escherichia coli TaxID=562 RepID=A0A376RP10_ECOLX|nr:Uncharacterised protein [Escherichia coli]